MSEHDKKFNLWLIQLASEIQHAGGEVNLLQRYIDNDVSYALLHDVFFHNGFTISYKGE